MEYGSRATGWGKLVDLVGIERPPLPCRLTQLRNTTYKNQRTVFWVFVPVKQVRITGKKAQVRPEHILSGALLCCCLGPCDISRRFDVKCVFCRKKCKEPRSCRCPQERGKQPSRQCLRRSLWMQHARQLLWWTCRTTFVQKVGCLTVLVSTFRW